MARTSDFFLFSKESKSEKICFLFGWGEGNGGLASVSEYLFYKESKSKKKNCFVSVSVFFFFFFFFLLLLFFFFFFFGGGGR